jgi:hypothetical protein
LHNCPEYLTRIDSMDSDGPSFLLLDGAGNAERLIEGTDILIECIFFFFKTILKFKNLVLKLYYF